MNTVQLYNFIDKIVKQIPFVKNYSNKDVYEVWMNEEIKYGAVSFLVENAYTTENSTKFNVILYYGDRLTSDKNNVSQVQSDAIAVIQAIVGAIQQSDGPIEVSYPVQEVLFEQKFADELAGAYARFSITTRGMGECDFDVDYPIVPGIVDINEYYNKKEVDTLLNTKADKDKVYAKTETYDQKTIDDKIANVKVDLSDYYNIEQVDTKLATKADKSNTYTKKQVDDRIKSAKPDLSSYYDREEINTKLNTKADKGSSYLKTETYNREEINNKIANVTVDLSEYYKIPQVDAKLNKKADKITVEKELNKKVNNIDFESFKNTNTEELNKKVNNVDFNSFKTANTKELNKKVNNTDFESFKTANTKELNNKVNNSELDNYYKKEETYNQAQVDTLILQQELNFDDKIAEKVNNSELDNYYKKEETYNKTDINRLLDKKVNKTDFESFKTSNTEILNTKADNESTYTKLDVNGLLDLKADKSDTFTKQEVTDAITSAMVVDEQMSETSTNPVQNKVITKYINDKLGEINIQLMSILNDKYPAIDNNVVVYYDSYSNDGNRTRYYRTNVDLDYPAATELTVYAPYEYEVSGNPDIRHSISTITIPAGQKEYRGHYWPAPIISDHMGLQFPASYDYTDAYFKNEAGENIHTLEIDGYKYIASAK